MEEFICIILCIITIVLFKIIFKINIKEAKKLEQNEQLQKLTDKFPKNIEIAKEMLGMLDNNGVIIEEAKDTKTSLYIAITNKIIIADLKDNYGRIQTIAHECLHSVQDRTLLLFNFIFSNISMMYFIASIVWVILKVKINSMMQIFILLILGLIQFAVRGYLEIDAMTKSKYLAEEYINKKDLCTKDEKDKLIKEYDKINKMGISFTLGYLITNLLGRIIIYLIIAMIF